MWWRSRFAIAVMAAALMTLPATALGTDEQPERDWTVLMYFGADNDLYQATEFCVEQALKGLNEAAADGSKVAVVLLIDGPNNGDTRVYELTKDGRTDLTSSALGTGNAERKMTDPQTMIEFLTSVEEDPFALQCTKCGAFQEEVKAGNNYLVLDLDGKRAYNMLRSMGMSGRPAMVLTSEFPGKVREEYSLGDDFEVKWFSETTGDIDSVDIKGLEADAMETISTFLMTTKRAGLLLDCVESVISKNSFDEALAFIKRVNDLAKVHGASVITWFDRERIPEGQAKSLSDEFDEVHDYL